MKDEVLEIVREYRQFREAGRPSPVSTHRLPDGRTVELCQTNGSDWTLCAVRPDDSALTPIAFGDDVHALLRRYEEILPAWDPALWPPVSAVVEGVARVFVPAGMSLLLGALELRQGALLLGVVKRAATAGLALIHVDARRVNVVHYGGPMDLRAVDMDALLDLQGGELRAELGALDPELLAAFARLLARALRPRKRADPRRRGAGSVHLFMWVIVRLVRLGVDDLYGRLSDIDGQVKAYLPGIDLPSEVLGDNLALMLGTGTCLAVLEDRVMWRLRLAELGRVGSPLHRRFCAEAPRTVADVDDFARVCAVDAPPARARYRGAPSRAANTAASVAPRPEASEPTQAAGSETAAIDPAGAEASSQAAPSPVLLAFIRTALERAAGLIPVSETVAAEPSNSPPAGDLEVSVVAGPGADRSKEPITG